LLPSSADLSSSYQKTLPDFIQAAAEGNLQELQNMIEKHKNRNESLGNRDGEQDAEKRQAAIQILINTRDKHGSIAEHWAAGGGHLECLQYLIQIRREHCSDTLHPHLLAASNITRRRRDGKTCLHYAARNGQMECIKYIVDEKIYQVDVSSNDGTTPLHMACYGGQIDAIWYLIERYNANVHQMNDYGCAMVHWIGLSPFWDNNVDQGHRVVKLLSKLLDLYGISLFLMTQKHGHTILHKAAQKLNQPIIEFFFTMNHLTPEQNEMIGGIPDSNGHTVSSIWRSFGGNEAFAQRIQKEKNW
jgi:ankyrin repeat protein